MTRAQAGFTLIEAMVALLIVALALPVIFRGAADGLALSSGARHYEEAVSRARSHLAAIADTGRLRAETQRGDDGGGFGWRVEVREVGVAQPGFAAPANAADAADQTAASPRLALYDIAVSETWRADGVTRGVRLATRRFQPATGP